LYSFFSPFSNINFWQLQTEIIFAGKYYGDLQRIIFIRYEMPAVLRMRVFLAYKLSFRLL